MARLVFTAVRTKNFRAQLMRMQDAMQEWNDYVRTSPKAKPYVADALAKFAVKVGLAGLLNGATVNIQNSAGTAKGTGTAVVDAAGAITAIRPAATSAVVLNGEVRTGVAPTGTYTTSVTFTVAGGVITAIVLA